MAEKQIVWYCGHCGDEKPLKLGFMVVDPRYAIVRCGGYDRSGISNREVASAIVGARAQEKAQAAAERVEAKERRAKQIEKERRAAFGR